MHPPLFWIAEGNNSADIYFQTYVSFIQFGYIYLSILIIYSFI